MPQQKLKAKAKPTDEQLSQQTTAATHKVIETHIGGVRNIGVVRNEEGDPVDLRYYLLKERRYDGGPGAIVSLADFITHEEAFPAIDRIWPGNPTLQKQTTLRNSVVALLSRICAQDEEYLSTFDAYNYTPAEGEPIHRFAFSNRGVCEIYREGGRYMLEEGRPNRPEYRLWSDVEGEVAGDEEFKANIVGLIEHLEVYYPLFKSKNGSLLLQSIGKEDITATPPDSWTGNYAIDLLLFILANGWTPTDIRHLLSLLGVGENAKSFVLQLVQHFLGTQVMDVNIESSAFTEGTETCFGARLLDARRQLLYKRIAAGQDSIRNGIVDTRFVKGATSVDETIEMGGMYKTSMNVNLMGSFILASNSVLRLNDPSQGTTRRIHYLRHTEIFTGRSLTKAEMFGIFNPFAATFRRLMLEAIRYRVEVQSCRKVAPHAVIDKDASGYRQAAAWSLSSHIARSLRRV